MDRVETRLADIARSDGQATAAIVSYTGSTRGKRLRARLVFLCAEVFGRLGDSGNRAGRAGTGSLVDLAAAVELVHLASLLHDDLVDGSDTRRGIPTVARVWGAPAAVLAGDYLFAAAFRMLVEGGQYHALGSLSGALRAMSEAEIEQLGALWDVTVSEETYWRCVRGKTGSLFAAACEAGAAAGGASPGEIELAKEFGMALGCAFQAVDDLLDLTGDPDRMGKPVGQDLARGLLTLPVIRALADSREGASLLRSALTAQRTGPDVAALAKGLLDSTGAAGYARSQIAALVRRADSCLESLPPHRQPLATGLLRPLTEVVATRAR